MCNFQCPFCWHGKGNLKSKLGWMSWDLYKKIIDETAGHSMGLKLQSRGESFLHPKIFEAIEYAKKKGFVEVFITTNGSLLNPNVGDKILLSGLDVLIFSIDDAHRQGCGGDYHDVVDKMSQFILQRNHFNWKTPIVRLQIGRLDSQNDEEFEAFLEEYVDSHRLRKLADEVVYTVEFQHTDDSDPIPNEKLQKNKCPIAWQRMLIGWDGRVTFDCRDFNFEYDYGNVNDKSIKEIWNGPEFKHHRYIHKHGLRGENRICRHCEQFLG